jgi:glutathione synthase/RimK-type ligase-like ATP-grasp enzyme
VIVLWGLPGETPLARVSEALARRRAPVAWFDQRQMAGARCRWAIEGNTVEGQLRIDGGEWRLEDIDAVYTRALPVDVLPELQAVPSAARASARLTHQAFQDWCERAPIRIVNRTAAMASNSSKPYQLQLIARHGFAVPATLLTNAPERVRAFRAEHGRVVYKSASGIRSIVRELTDDDVARLEHIRWCPTQFQEWIDGLNVRVHVVGGRTFATSIETTATDYRYAAAEGATARLAAFDLDEDLDRRCVELVDGLNLAFAGVDLKLTPDDRVVCFEVNPNPAFTYYEDATGQPIADAVAAFLVGEHGDAAGRRGPSPWGA